MFLLIALAITVAVSKAWPLQLQVERPVLDGRVVGGSPASIEEFPYQVSLQTLGMHFCGGSILSEYFILTAAHCTNQLSAEDLKVRVGSTYKEAGGEIYTVQTIHQNPNFDLETLDYDISILRLQNSLIFSNSASPIALPSLHAKIPHDTKFYVTGWGVLQENGMSPAQLQVVEVPFIEKNLCQAAYKDVIVSDRMICAGAKHGGKDACQGDSGGPLVARGLLVGIVSWGYGCARPDFPGVYTNVAELRDFIRNTTLL